MKYLQSYKLFESIKTDLDPEVVERIQTIEDILLDLEDEEKYYCGVSPSPLQMAEGNSNPDLTVMIHKKKDIDAVGSWYSTISVDCLQILKDSIVRIIRYMKSEGYKYEMIYSWEDGSSSNAISHPIEYAKEIQIGLYRNSLDIDLPHLESKSAGLKFVKQPKKKAAKTDIYNVTKSGKVIGLVKWSSRMRGYAFLPTPDCDVKIKEFVKDLMKKRREEKKK